MKATLIISIYKNVPALQAVLDSLKAQTEQDFELILSEDGEDPAMASFIQHYNFPWETQHLTQQDIGWRKERALNNAVQAAHTDWLIFIDGDCVLHPRFIEMHIRHAKPNIILAGKRMRLSPALSQQVLQHGLSCLWRNPLLLRGCSHIEEGIFCTRTPRKKVKHLIGSNMSVSRQALISINGFDENYTLPATGEDYDIEWRLLALGYHMVSLKNLSVQYHLYHKENWSGNDENMTYCLQKQKTQQIICKNGINKL